MFRFIAADLRRHWIGATAVLLIIAFATALGVMVTLQERALRLGSARAASAFDLVVGAPGSETQLVLSSVFLQPAPLPLLPGSVLAGLRADPRVAWAAPIGFGDFAGEAPVVGTTQDLVIGLGGVAEGRGFARLGEAVVGARAALAPGETFHPLHGRLHEGGEAHASVTYTVVGRLAPTGTAWDRAVLVPIEAVWRVHGHAAGEAANADAEGQHADHDHDHDGHAEAALDLDTAIDLEATASPVAPGVPAILVKPRTIADAYKLRQAFRTERTLAVFPGEVLTRLYGTLGDARLILAAVAAAAQLLVAAAILLVVAVQVLQRRRQIGALRAFGAPRAAVFAIVWLEVFLVSGAGMLAGFVLGYGAARLASSMLTAASGVALPVAFVAADALSLAVLVGLAALVAAAPAVLAYRQAPASALRA
ncbi:FtsX-like permease family protein [Labrys wisconsinensis]|uniref:ABC transport system permease protein n=1 Tax=Labrys wisconsinensis TaxID=425677 RepID=A0ABU0JGQ8_9HYPH|nr:ABC transporter permease [Labrys wisconsinensis]MDQ0472588.1 putative ABC transport system permease protein [Labrys wisconsinensis]